MIKRLIKTLPFENGELYGIIEGRRILLAYCAPRAEIFEHLTNVPLLGVQEYRVKKHHVGIVLCPAPDTTRKIDAEFLRKVSRFELSADIQRMDGIIENIRFDRLTPEEIDLDGDWSFSVTEPSELLRKLLGL
ncbi:MAG: hypothetical protein K2N94_12095 [Lachnospiraceae bacterium]|nr:hypothetical protein [Lachnospiraceae bacterium]